MSGEKYSDHPYRSTEIVVPPQPTLWRRFRAMLRSIFALPAIPPEEQLPEPPPARVECRPNGAGGVSITFNEIEIVMMESDLKACWRRLVDIDLGAVRTFAVRDYVGGIHLIPEDIAEEVRSMICTCAEACR